MTNTANRRPENTLLDRTISASLLLPFDHRIPALMNGEGRIDLARGSNYKRALKVLSEAGFEIVRSERGESEMADFRKGSHEAAIWIA